MLIKPYQASWADDFATIAVALRVVLGTDLRIEHVGSTSVPGLAAKPIIDIDLVFGEATGWNTVKAGLIRLGYAHHGDQGISGREVFKREPDIERHPALDKIAHHLYVCHTDGEELRRHLRFRDALRASEDARTAYADLKREVADRAGQERKTYAALKEEMARELVERIMAGDFQTG